MARIRAFHLQWPERPETSTLNKVQECFCIALEQWEAGSILTDHHIALVRSFSFGPLFLTNTSISEFIECRFATEQDLPILAYQLELVKNYILGNIMKGFDGSFSAMDRFQMLNQQGLGYEYYENLMVQMKEMTAEKVQHAAVKYMDYGKLKKIVVGKL
jgi:predicted Zn-dependent peptidase